MILAIFQNERVYEGNDNFLNAVIPFPALSKLVMERSAPLGLEMFPAASQFQPPLFREDSFDPTTRLRRGRFYAACSPSRKSWQVTRVSHRPYDPPVGSIPTDYQMDAYESAQIPRPIKLSDNAIVALGDTNFHTLWRVVGAERLFNGETLFTLKATTTLGVLPELTESKLPPERRAEIVASFEGLVDAAQKYLPVPIADVCREFARLALSASLPENPQEDLGGLANLFSTQKPAIASAATIIGRLHARGKSSEQEKQASRGNPLRGVSIEDAELALSLVGFILRDFGWAA